MGRTRRRPHLPDAVSCTSMVRLCAASARLLQLQLAWPGVPWAAWSGGEGGAEGMCSVVGFWC